MPLLSVVIPVRNGEGTLKKCLQSIREQSVEKNMEIIVLDSNSTDKSVSIAKGFGAKVIDIKLSEFNHGLSRNVGANDAAGEFIYFTVQDAYLAENDQLQKMLKHFTDSEIQAVTGMQAIPNDPDKNPAMWFKRYSTPKIEIRHFSGNSFSALSKKDKLENSRWDNVNAMYRASALKTLPFREVSFAEDALWAFDALSRGWKIIRDSSLVVFHYHHQSFRYTFNTNYIINYTFWQNFHVMPSFQPTVKPLLQNGFTLYKRKQLLLVEKVKWFAHNAIRYIAAFCSVGTFRLAYFFGKQKLLDKTFHYFCSIVPQGSLQKKSNK